MKPASPDTNHVEFTRAVRRTMRDLGVEADRVAFSKDEMDELLGRRVRRAESPKKAGAGEDGPEEDRATRPAPLPPPPRRSPLEAPGYEGLRTYEASQEELEEAGAPSVDELVRIVNEVAREAGQFPVTQADYPSTRKKFERLLERRRKLEGSPAPSTP